MSKSEKQNRYTRILARKDKKRPFYFQELIDRFQASASDSFVLEAKLLFPSGGTMRLSWNERDFPEEPA